MQKRVHVYELDGESRTVELLDDEQFSSATLMALKPSHRVSAVQSLVNMAGLVSGRSSRELGSRGPVVASRANRENSGDATVGVYDAMFGRDSLRIASMLHRFRPELETATVEYWAARQGTVHNSANHEEPGKIAHEYRDDDDPQRAVNEAKGFVYPDFGSMDSTPLWLIAAGRRIAADPSFASTTVEHVEGERLTIATAMHRALDRMEAWRSSNPEGLIEADASVGAYGAFPYWKDSPDAYHRSNGELAQGNVSSVEVMGYAFQAYDDLAKLAREHPGLELDSEKLAGSAEQVKSAIFDHFWIESEGFFAQGVERRTPESDVEPLVVKSSNMGYLLSTGIFDGDGDGRNLASIREQLVGTLFSDDMLCPAGIRTLGANEVRFRPSSYHNGASWPMDTYTIAEGLERDYPRLAKVLNDCVRADCHNFLPEFLPGTDDPNPTPGDVVVRVDAVNSKGKEINRSAEKVPEPMQGWTAAAFAAVKMNARKLDAEIRDRSVNQTRETRFEERLLMSLEQGNVLALDAAKEMGMQL